MMIKVRVLTFCLFFVAMISTFIDGAKAQFDDYDAFESNVRMLEEAAPQQFSTFGSKLDLVYDVWWLYQWRVELKPAGYEFEESFQEGFEMLLSEFSSTLFSESMITVTVNPLDSSQTQDMYASYEENKDSFADFVAYLQETNPYYAEKTQDDIADILLNFAILANDGSMSIWDRLKDLTGFFPFC